MTVTANIKLLHSCSFCGKNQTQVKTLVSGNGVYICNECVDLCMDVIRPKQVTPVPARASLTPPDIVAHLDQHVIGQDLAKKTVAVAIYNHLQRLAHGATSDVKVDKSNILMIGSSGVGKCLHGTTRIKVKIPKKIANLIQDKS